MSKIISIVRHRPRLLVAIALGVLAGFLLPSNIQTITKILIGWNIAVWFYLLLVAWLIANTDHEAIQKIADQEDESAIAVLLIMSVAATLSFAAIGLELASVSHLPASARAGSYALTVISVVGSWLLVGAIFTFHYAHLFYLSSKQHRAFTFPDKTQQPNYWDFLYFSFTISAAAQTSDVAVMNTAARKTVTAHTVLSFVFNVAIVGLLINIAAGIIGGH